MRCPSCNKFTKAEESRVEVVIKSENVHVANITEKGSAFVVDAENPTIIQILGTVYCNSCAYRFEDIPFGEEAGQSLSEQTMGEHIEGKLENIKSKIEDLPRVSCPECDHDDWVFTDHFDYRATPIVKNDKVNKVDVYAAGVSGGGSFLECNNCGDKRRSHTDDGEFWPAFSYRMVDKSDFDL